MNTCAFYNYLFSLKPIFHLRSLHSSPLNFDLNNRTQTKIKVPWRYQNCLLLFWISGTGVSLKDIQEHVMREIPELKERVISCDCIHFSIKPLQKNVIRAYRYKQLVDAWIPGKKNSYCEDNVNQHFFSRVPCREEFVSKFNSKCPCFLCDDMNKIKMGTASALSRYHQV